MSGSSLRRARVFIASLAIGALTTLAAVGTAFAGSGPGPFPK